MKRIASVALLVALTTGPLGAEDLPVAGKAPVLRHLAFDFKSASTYSHEARGVKDLADAQGANTAHYDDRQEAIGTIVCDVVAVTADGGLVIDLREDGPQRKVASTRVGVQDRGQIVNLDPKQPLGEEIMVLLRFLGRNVIGAWERPAGETWEIENASGTYKAKATFHVTSVPAADDERVDVDEEFVARGAEAYSGTLHGKVAFDRTKSVPRTVAVETRTRIDRMGQYTLVSHHFDFALKEDSFSKK